MKPVWTMTTGTASAIVARNSAFAALPLENMRIGLLVTVATLVLARDSVAQTVSIGAQAIPVVTRADPTAGARTITEGYVSQPVIMGHAMWNDLRAVGTFDLEGLTLERGELSTGGYGEGYVDRRHPHAYVHELLLGNEFDRRDWSASVFAGRGFAPFGSDDPMTRPFEKYPVNHHLAQVLERVVAIGAARYKSVIGEIGTFNGDEPLSPGSSPNYRRFGDSWATRLTVLPIRDLELSGSFAKVASPEVRVGHGLDQHKTSLVARFSRLTPDLWRYAFVEYAHTDELTRSTNVNSLSSALAEAGICRAGFSVAGRLERTDRVEEEPSSDPFRTIRPATDLHGIGLSRWTTATVSVASPRMRWGIIDGRPFAEAARINVTPGSPAGLFSAQARYGTNHLWMLSAGLRLHAGVSHDRMGRYGAALPPGAMAGMSETHDVSDMGEMDMPGMQHQAVENRCRP